MPDCALPHARPMALVPLPASEPLLADRPEHLIPWTGQEAFRGQEHHFTLPVPEQMYHRGELYNLSVSRGTLTAEERFKIAEHVIQTILLLEQLPLPHHLRQVPALAGAHHETLRGTGYPRGLSAAQLSLPARIISIADVFDALTAPDRPYKKANKLSEAVALLAQLREAEPPSFAPPSPEVRPAPRAAAARHVLDDDHAVVAVDPALELLRGAVVLLLVADEDGGKPRGERSRRDERDPPEFRAGQQRRLVRCPRRTAQQGAPPVDGVTPSTDDLPRITDDAERAKRMGFGAKLCIHPKQVAIVQAAFMPTEEEVHWAQRVIEADKASKGGAVKLDGKMIDRPVVLLAKRTLAIAGKH